MEGSFDQTTGMIINAGTVNQLSTPLAAQTNAHLNYTYNHFVQTKQAKK